MSNMFENTEKNDIFSNVRKIIEKEVEINKKFENLKHDISKKLEINRIIEFIRKIVELKDEDVKDSRKIEIIRKLVCFEIDTRPLIESLDESITAGESLVSENKTVFHVTDWVKLDSIISEAILAEDENEIIEMVNAIKKIIISCENSDTKSKKRNGIALVQSGKTLTRGENNSASENQKPRKREISLVKTTYANIA